MKISSAWLDLLTCLVGLLTPFLAVLLLAATARGQTPTPTPTYGPLYSLACGKVTCDSGGDYQFPLLSGSRTASGTLTLQGTSNATPGAVLLNPGGGNVGIGTTSPGAQLQVNAATSTTIGSIIKGAASQSANLTEWRNSSDAVLASVDSAGKLGIGTAGPGAKLTIAQSADGVTNGFRVLESANPLNYMEAYEDGTTGGVIRSSSAGGTARYDFTFQGLNQHFQTYYNTWSDKMTILAAGNVGIGTTSPGAQLQVNASRGSVVGEIVRAAATPTADIQQWQNASATPLAGVTYDGKIYATGMNIPRPWGMFSTIADQAVGNVALAYPVVFGTPAAGEQFRYQMPLPTPTGTPVAVDYSRIGITEAGTYRIFASAIVHQSTGSGLIDCWLAVNGVPVANSNTQLNMSNADRLIAVEWLETFAVGDYFEIMYHGSDTRISLKGAAAQTTPAVPLSPAVIIVTNKVSGN